MGARRKARELALMILYQIDVADAHADIAIDRFFAAFGGDQDLDPPPPYLPASGEPPAPPSEEARAYASTLVRGVAHNQEAIDDRIREVSSHWRLDRMARVDRNILRLGTFELAYQADEVPRKVVINEAVEIAKSFSTAESSAFINGVLDRVKP